MFIKYKLVKDTREYDKRSPFIKCHQHFLEKLFKCLLAIVKTRLELKTWTSRNQEFRQSTNGKQRGPQRNSLDISSTNVSSLICFHLNHGRNAMTTSHQRNIFENSKTRRGSFLLPFIHWCLIGSCFTSYIQKSEHKKISPQVYAILPLTLDDGRKT
jgi:hypothetical protein